ncbi:MAG TPA: magnesium transporter CorA family protein [Bacteroidia bacterium]|nr:magnesium transporter CorA family protein [Sphingobacteriales bacterium]HPD65499.1 magnesium transporter CorA family protein [Bacteroidia bacterium]HRS59154.1 magnesium transporter CorA family protein [Bacteroidia bacterium]HRU67450.1 magnesium transporter CorA family protein [Bacteroidia bacterium]
MITYFSKEGGLKVLPAYEKNCWINVEKPTNEEVKILSGIFSIPEDFITDILDIDERSRLEIEDKWLFIIIRIPVHVVNDGVPYITVPLGILISDETIITICQYDNDVIPLFIRQERLRKIDFENNMSFVLQIFLIAANTYLKYLKQINIQTSIIEADLERSTRNKELQRLLKMEKCLVYFITSLKSNELVLARMKSSRHIQMNEYNEDFLEDVIIENKQALEIANIYSDIQSGLMDAFASVISNNLNAIMKRLTSVTIILMIPTLIASFFGMNIKNYLELSSSGFYIVVSASLALAIGIAYFFRKINWL